MTLCQLDITCAYLKNGVLEERIFMEPPKELPEIVNRISRRNQYNVCIKAAEMLEILKSGEKI